MIKKRVVIFCLIFFLFFNIFYKVSAKYTITSEAIEVIKIEKADTVKPNINGRNSDVDGEIFKDDVNVTYSDDFGIGSAKYWYNPDDKVFSRRR